MEVGGREYLMIEEINYYLYRLKELIIEVLSFMLPLLFAWLLVLLFVIGIYVTFYFLVNEYPINLSNLFC